MSVPTTTTTPSSPVQQQVQERLNPESMRIPARTHFTEDMREIVLAVCMGRLERLGVGSPFFFMDPDTFRMICIMLLQYCIHVDAAYQHLPIIFRRYPDDICDEICDLADR